MNYEIAQEISTLCALPHSLESNVQAIAPLPDTIMNIQTICKDKNATIYDLANYIESENFLKIQLLKEVNAPLYCFNKEITSVYQAVSLFGMNLTRSVLLGNSIRKLVGNDLSAYGLKGEEFDNISNMQAMLMYNWYSKIDPKKMQSLYLASYLQEIGKTIINTNICNDEKNKFINDITHCSNISRVEFSYVEETTSSVTASMLKHWRFEDSFIRMIHYSESYELAPTDIKEFSTALNIVRTIIPINNPLSESSIINGLKKAKKAGYDHELLEDQVNLMLDQLECSTQKVKTTF